jgi:hypothetical protein
VISHLDPRPTTRWAIRTLVCVLALAGSAVAARAATVESRVLVLDRASELGSVGDGYRFAVRHALDAVGVAYDVVPFSTSAAALDPASHPMAVIDTYLDQGEVPAGVRLALEQYVAGGGTLFATQIEDRTLLPLFGATAETRTRNAFWVDFVTTADPVLFARHDRPAERQIRLADPALFTEAIDRVGVYQLAPGAVVLGRLRGRGGEDVGVTMLRRDVGAGRAYLLGVTLFTAIMRNEANRDAEAQRVFINELEPAGDAVRLLLLGALDRATGGRTVRRHTQPGVHDTALLVTHDWDSEDAFGAGEWGEPIARQLTNLEAALDVPATSFLTTKFFADEQGPAFWTPQVACDAAEVSRQVFGSHSVGHFTDFEHAPAGPRDVTCADYDPDQPTVNGEIRCSLERIVTDLPPCLGGPVEPAPDSFRAGYLRFPQSLPQELEAAGYRYDSTRSAADVMTYYPFRLMEDSFWHRETSIVEIPLAADDVELGPDDPLHVVHHWRETMKALAGNGAPFVLLIHPSRGHEPVSPSSLAPAPVVRPTAHRAAIDRRTALLSGSDGTAPVNPDAEFKLRALASIVRFARDHGWPIVELREWAEHWRRREEIEISSASYDTGSATYTVVVRNRGAEPATDVTIDYASPVVLASVAAGGAVEVESACTRLSVGRIAEGASITLVAAVDTADQDGDGTVDRCDNCPALPNPAQADFDGDRIGDACESAGDVDRSGRVDGADLALLAGAFGADELRPHYHDGSDLDRSGAIDGDDLAILAGRFGAGP